MGVRPVGVNIGSLNKFFPQHEIETILRASGREGQRRRKLPALDLMYYLIALGLHASEGCRSVLRQIMVRKGGREDEDLERLCSDSAITQARTRLGWQPLRALYEGVVRPIATRSSIGAWFGRWRLVTLDGSTLDVADTRRNERAFGRPGSARGKSGFPQLRFVTLLENGTHVLFGAELGRYNTSETTMAKKVVKRLPADSLCMADRHFFSYSLWKTALATGAALLWRARADLILPKLKRFSDGSYLTKLYPSQRARARDINGIPARLITYRLGKGREEYRLLCSILDPRKAPAIQLANLYARRWTIETVLAELKTRLRGARVVLRSRIPDLTRQDFWGLLLAHFGVRALMHEGALEQKIEANDLSFTHAVRTIARYLPLYVSFFPSAEQEALQITLA
jgi:Insertion element 4 transposase N-terminal/Transposase DDE domain